MLKGLNLRDTNNDALSVDVLDFNIFTMLSINNSLSWYTKLKPRVIFFLYFVKIFQLMFKKVFSSILLKYKTFFLGVFLFQQYLQDFANGIFLIYVFNYCIYFTEILLIQQIIYQIFIQVFEIATALRASC